LAARLAIHEDAISPLYVEAVEWARKLLSGHEEAVSPSA